MAQHHPQPASNSHPASRPRPTSQPHLLAMDVRAFLSRHSLTDTAHLSSRSSSLSATLARDHGRDSRWTFPGCASPRSPDSPFKRIRDPPRHHTSQSLPKTLAPPPPLAPQLRAPPHRRGPIAPPPPGPYKAPPWLRFDSRSLTEPAALGSNLCSARITLRPAAGEHLRRRNLSPPLVLRPP